jgi:hypothetical protein
MLADPRSVIEAGSAGKWNAVFTVAVVVTLTNKTIRLLGLGQESAAVLMPVQLPAAPITPNEVSQEQEYVGVAIRPGTSGESLFAAV